MNFKDKIRNEIYENERIENEKLSNVANLDLDLICENCLHNRAQELFDEMTQNGRKAGSIIQEDGKRIFRIEKNYKNMSYFFVPQETKRYFDSLNLPKDKAFTTSDGLYELRYIKYDYSLLDDEWDIVRTKQNKNGEMHIDTRKEKVGIFGSNYKYEWKVDKCYDLKRFILWFTEIANKEAVEVKFLPYLEVNISKGRSTSTEYKTLKSFDNWYPCESSPSVSSVGVKIIIEVEL